MDKGQLKESSRGKKLPLIVTFADFYDVKKDSGEVAGWDNHLPQIIFTWNREP